MRTQSAFKLKLDPNETPCYFRIKEPILLTYNQPLYLLYSACIVHPVYISYFRCCPPATALIVISHGKVAKIFTPFRANDTTRRYKGISPPRAPLQHNARRASAVWSLHSFRMQMLPRQIERS